MLFFCKASQFLRPFPVQHPCAFLTPFSCCWLFWTSWLMGSFQINCTGRFSGLFEAEFYEQAGSRHHPKQLNTFRYHLMSEYIVSSPWHMIQMSAVGQKKTLQTPSAPVKPELLSPQPAWFISLWIYQSGQAHGFWSCPQSNVALEGSLSSKLRGDLWCLKNN